MVLTRNQLIKTIIIIIAVNALVIGIIISIFKGRAKEEIPVAQETKEEIQVVNEIVEEVEEDPINEVDFDALINEKSPDESMRMLYANILPTTYKLGNDTAFKFYTDGTYEGYFDEDHLNVAGYSYELVNLEEGIVSLVITSPNGMSSVVYNLEMDINENFLLCNPASEEHEILYTLSFDDSGAGVAYEGAAPVETPEEVEGEETKTAE